MKNDPPTAPRHRGADGSSQSPDDEYGWSRTSPPAELRQHLEAEEKHFVARMNSHRDLASTICAELIAIQRATAPTESPTLRVGPWIYWQRTAGSAAGQLLRRRADETGEPSGPTEVVIDDDANQGLIPGYRRDATDVSSHGDVVAFAQRAAGGRQHDIVISSPTHSEVAARSVSAAFALSPDGGHLYFLITDTTGRPFQVWQRSVGPGLADRLLFHEPDPHYRVHLRKSRCTTALLITSRSRSASSILVALFVDLKDGGALRTIRRKAAGQIGSVETVHIAGTSYVGWLEQSGEEDGAWAVALRPHSQPRRLLNTPGTVLTRMQSLEGGLAIEVRYFGRPYTGHVAKAELQQWESADAPLNGDDLRLATTSPSTLADNADWSSEHYSVVSTSLTKPPEITAVAFDANASMTTPSLADDSATFVEERVEVMSRDGVLIPMYIAHAPQNGRGRDAPRSVVMRFYGCYGTITDPVFTPATAALLARGISVALVHPRGGGELGPEWWAAGRKAHKERSVNDVIDCTEYLIESGTAQTGYVALEGHSAGGFIAASALIRRPELFSTAVLTNPFIDPVGALSDPDLPLAVSDWTEWGNPRHSEEDLHRLKKLSPYDSLPSDCSAIPQVLLVGSLDDERVSIVEPAKFAARIRDRGGRALLHVRMSSDHSFAGSTDERNVETAHLLAWICAASTRTAEAPTSGVDR